MMKSEKEKILIVHNYYQLPGGEDIVVDNEKKLLEEHGHNVFFYGRNNAELNNMNVLQKLMLPINMIFNLKTYREIRALIQDKHIDIVHVHNTLLLISPSVYYAAVSCGIPVVQTIHNFRLLCPGATFYREGHICEECVKKGLGCAVKHGCYRGSRTQSLACVISTKFHRMTGILKKINYICLTDFNRRKLLGSGQFKGNRIFVKPNFIINNGAFVPTEKRKNQIVFAGRMEKLKGLDVMLSAWKQMGNDAPPLIICGKGPMETWCRQYTAKNKLRNVKMVGFISNQEVQRLVAESKALILPTRWYEGFPMSIVEAFAAGTPVLCSDLGNPGCIVENGISGIKFPVNDIDGLAKAVLEIYQYKKIHETTLGVYLKNYTPESNYLQLSKIYRQAFSARAI